LIIWAREEEVAVRFDNGTCGERDDGDVCDVEGGEDCEGVGGVFLDSYDYFDVSMCMSVMSQCPDVPWMDMGGYGETYATTLVHGLPIAGPAYSFFLCLAICRLHRRHSDRGNSSSRGIQLVFLRRGRGQPG
jgi:hypothetical protein